MQKPKTFAQARWRESLTELLALYIACVLGATHLLSMHWVVAVVVAPVLVLGLLAVIVTFVQALWLTVVSLEKLGTSLGFRKSPLA